MVCQQSDYLVAAHATVLTTAMSAPLMKSFALHKMI